MKDEKKIRNGFLQIFLFLPAFCLVGFFRKEVLFRIPACLCRKLFRRELPEAFRLSINRNICQPFPGAAFLAHAFDPGSVICPFLDILCIFHAAARSGIVFFAKQASRLLVNNRKARMCTPASWLSYHN
jgi:hypothetical protein